MLTYLGHRLFILVPTLLAISALVFGIIQLPPGNFLDTLISEMSNRGDGDVEKVKFLIDQHHLDKSIPEQYVIWLLRAFQGDLGYSFEYSQPVAAIIGDRLLLTFLVTLATVFFTYLIAFPIGIYSATRQYSWGDYGLTFLGFLGLATPSFLLALVLLYLTNRYFGISIGGLMEPEYVDQPWSLDKMVSVLQHLIVPTLVIGTAGTAGMIRRLRANLLDELQKQYVVTGRAKGLPFLKLLLKYPLRMSLNPFISDIGDLLPELVSGSVIVSIVMSLPTTGPMLVTALRSQDIFLAQSFLIFLALLTVIGIFLSDLALAALDPRIRLHGGATK